MTDDGRIDGGLGWYIDRETLLPVIEDIQQFSAPTRTIRPSISSSPSGPIDHTTLNSSYV